MANQWPYIDIFRKYKDNIDTFVETGTHYGASVQDAIDLGFKKILSVDINSVFVCICLEKFEKEINSGQVKLFLGNSALIFPKMLEEVTERSMFWLDAHQHANSTVLSELAQLYSHPIKNHTIIIDDIPLYFIGENKTKLENTIKTINPNYIIEYNPMHNQEEYQLIAHE
ncbi:MAG: hypothetical protein WC346_05235 [Methanogenium sp.]|jgi:hypothetical protein